MPQLATPRGPTVDAGDKPSGDLRAAVHRVPVGRAGRSVDLSQVALRRLYGRFDKTALALFVLAAPLFSALWWGLFQGLTGLGQPAVGDGGLLARSDDSLLMIPAVWAGLLSAYGVSRLAMRRLLGRRYHAYWLYRRLGLGFDMPRVATALAVFTAVLAVFSIYVVARDYTAFTADRIVYQSWKGDGFSQPYSEIAAVRAVAAADGAAAHYRIEFHDGTLWRSDWGLRAHHPYWDFKYASQAAFMSGRQVDGPALFDRARLEQGCTRFAG